MKIIDKYIVKKYLGTFFFMLLVILAISVVIDVAEKIDDFIEKKPPVGPLIFSYYRNFAIFYGNLLSPVCVFLAVIYFTSRMTSQTEFVPLLSSGVSFYRLMMPYLVTAIVIGGFSFYLNAYLVPIATRQRVDFEYQYLKTQRIMRDQNILKIVARDSEKHTHTILYLFSFNQIKKEGYTVTVTEIFKDPKTGRSDIRAKISAAKIVWQEGKRQWRLENTRTHHFNGEKESIVARPAIDTTFLITPDDIFIKDQKAESLPLNELYDAIELEKIRGSGLEVELIKEKYERFAYPFATIILTLIGFAVSTTKRRGGTPIQIGIGLILSFVYVLLLVAGQAIMGDKIAPWVAIWTPNFIFLAIAIILLKTARK
jgi:lipopolysaccharide export system permease protein